MTRTLREMRFQDNEGKWMGMTLEARVAGDGEF